MRVTCGGNGGDCGKLAEVGKVEVVRFVSADVGLYEVGGISHIEKPRLPFGDVMLLWCELRGEAARTVGSSIGEVDLNWNQSIRSRENLICVPLLISFYSQSRESSLS